MLMRDMQRMEMVLTSEQLRQVEKLKKRDQVSGRSVARAPPVSPRRLVAEPQTDAPLQSTQ